MKTFLAPLILACSILSLLPTSGVAITLDEFEENHAASADDVNPTASSVIAAPSAIGGFRSVEVDNNGTGFGVEGRVALCATPTGTIDCYQHSQNSGATGASVITWDADSLPGLTDLDGLGGMDFTLDGSTEFQLLVVAYDYPNNNAIDISLVVHNATEVGVSAVATRSVDQDVPDPDILLLQFPFASFSSNSSGVSAAETLQNVGALQLLIDGQAITAPDLDIALLKTNGVCEEIPLVGLPPVDQCGVCSGDGTSCLDCEDVPNGPSVPGEACDTGDIGFCGDGKWNGDCECEAVYTPIEEICDGLDNDCDEEIDEGGVCCSPQEEICDGEDNDCDDEIDEGGVCCEPVPCPECESEELDQGAKKLDNAIIRLVRQIKRILPRDAPGRKKYRKVLRESNALQIRNWVISWQLPQERLNCEQPQLSCVATNNSIILDEYLINNDALWRLFRRTFKELRSLKGGVLSKKLRRERRKIKKRYEYSQSLALSIPTTQYLCGDEGT